MKEIIHKYHVKLMFPETADNMPEYGFSLTYIPVKVQNPRENKDQRKPQGYDQKRKLFRINSFVLAHSSAKKSWNEQIHGSEKTHILLGFAQWQEMLVF